MCKYTSLTSYYAHTSLVHAKKQNHFTKLHIFAMFSTLLGNYSASARKISLQKDTLNKDFMF